MTPSGRRVAAALAASAVVGALLSWSGNGTFAGAAPGHFWGDVEELVAPWLVLPLAAGALVQRRTAGAVAGLAATMAALTAFYLVSTAAEDLGGHGVLGDLRLEFSGNLMWFELGALSGPVVGALACWWCRRRGHSAAVAAGALLVAEPLVRWSHAVSLLVAVGTAASWAELLAGAACVAGALAWRRHRATEGRPRRPVDAQPSIAPRSSAGVPVPVKPS